VEQVLEEHNGSLAQLKELDVELSDIQSLLGAYMVAACFAAM
jgi:hypothetical protein